MQETAPRSTARKVSLAFLIVLLLGQALVVLATIVVVGLGHGSAGQAAILFGGVGAASVLLLVLLAAAIRGTSKPVMTVWALAAPLLDVVAYAIVLSVAGGLGACNEGEAAALTSVSPPPGVELQGEPRDSEGICAQAFVASVPLGDVLGGYRTTLESDGWTVLSQTTQPGSAEGGGSAESGELTAQRGSFRFWVGVESGPGESGGTYVGGSISSMALGKDAPSVGLEQFGPSLYHRVVGAGAPRLRARSVPRP